MTGLTNQSAMFVATTLIGNNVANYLTSLAVVMLTQQVVTGDNSMVELAATVLFSPLVFVYGELLPKNLYYNAPNRLLRLGGPVLLIFTFVFLPVSLVLWGLGRALQGLLGETPLRVWVRLARKELQDVLDEGREAGILLPAQRHLAQNLFTAARQPVAEWCKPVIRGRLVRLDSEREHVIRMTERLRMNLAILANESGELFGYIRVIDLHLSEAPIAELQRPLRKISRDQSCIEALLWMRNERQEIAQVVGPRGETVGLLHVNDLVDPLFGGE